jgi:hypothetical protein
MKTASQTTSYTIVNRHNLRTLSLAIKLAIQQASYIAMDFEFTGLGDAKHTKAQYDDC